MSGRRVSRNQTDVENKVLRITPKTADGLTPYRKASLENELDNGDFVEGGTMRGSVLVRGANELPPASDGAIRRGEWIPTSPGENKRTVNTGAKAAVGAVAHSDMFLKKEALNKSASGASFSASQSGSGSTAGGSVERLAPEVYSPLFTMANLNLPRDRITVNAWCFLPETKVWLADGTRKNIEDIKIGDKVLSGNGNIRKVITIFKREIDEEIVGIKVKGGQDIIWTTKNHNFNAIKSNDVRCCNKDIYVKCKPSNNDKKFCKWCNRRNDPYNFVQISAGELERLDSVYMPIPNHTIHTEDSILNSVDGMQLLGYYVAEGSISRETGVYFNFGLHEEKLCYFIADQLYKIWGGPNKPIVRKREEKGGIQIEYHNKKASLFFRTHCGEGALTKKISDELLYAEPELLIHFLSTWLDGDGGQEKYNKNIFCGSTSSCNLAYQIRLMALRCGLVAHVFKEKTSKIKLWKNNRICNQADRYFVKIRGSAANIFSKKISSCVSRFNEIERQYNRDGCSFIHNNKLIQWIDGIQKRNYKGSVYNIEVEGDHTYVVGYGISVHNCRNFFQLHPIVRNAITLHATYPISKINIKCHDKKVLRFFEDMIEEMNLMESLGDIALEYWKLGECFPYAELDEKTGKWSKIVIQNPDYIHVKKTVLSGDPIILLKPDAVLKRLVMSSNPADVQLRKQIPEKIIYHVRAGQDIPLDNFNVSHLKMLSSPYDVRGTSIIVGVFKDLMLYDKLREAKFAQADGMINPITIIKVGGNADGDYRATQEDIEFFRQIFEEAQYDKDFKLITHAGVAVERIGFAGQVLEIGPDMELIIKNIYTGLMVPPAVVDTESAVYASASIGLEVLRQRYFNFRNMMANWLVNKIFAPISEIQDFYEYEGGVKRLIVPDVEWNQMNLYDLQDYIQNITGLVSQKQASLQTLYRSLGLSYQDEIVKMRQEMIRDAIRMKEEENLRKMTITELRALDPEKEILEPVDSKERESAGAPGGGMPEAGGMPGMGGAPEIPGGLGGLGGPGGGPELAPPPAGPAPGGGTPPGAGPAPMPGGPGM